jgi:hypothetical protein
MPSTGITATSGRSRESAFALRCLRFCGLRGSGLRCELVSSGILLSWHSPKLSIHAGGESELSHRWNGSFFPARAVSMELAARCFVADGLRRRVAIPERTKTPDGIVKHDVS